MTISKLNFVYVNFKHGPLFMKPICFKSSTQMHALRRENFEAFRARQARNYTAPPGTPGAGAGKGGGAGGSVRESGGGLGRYGAAQEEGYFYDKQKEDLKKIKKKLKDVPDAPDKQDK